MAPSNCCVPECNFRKPSKNRIGLFTVLRPEFAASEEEKHHREMLHKFVYSVRGETKKIIADKLCREM